MLIDRLDEIVSRYVPLEFEPNEGRRRECAAMVANNWPEIVARLSAAKKWRSDARQEIAVAERRGFTQP